MAVVHDNVRFVGELTLEELQVGGNVGQLSNFGMVEGVGDVEAGDGVVDAKAL